MRIHGSSGTTGKPIVSGYTQNDIEVWSEMMARTLTAAGCTQEDIVQVAYGLGLFTGGFGAYQGADRPRRGPPSFLRADGRPGPSPRCYCS